MVVVHPEMMQVEPSGSRTRGARLNPSPDMGANPIGSPLMVATMQAMNTYEATICDGTPRGQTMILGERRAWLAVGTGATERGYRLACEDGRHLLYVPTTQRLPSLAKAVGFNEGHLIERICREFRAQAAKSPVLPEPWRWAISREFFGHKRVLLRSRLTTQPAGIPSIDRAEACVEA
jgi:hypothetical protein